MSIFGNNILAFVTWGMVIYVDEPTSEQVGMTEFDENAIACLDSFLQIFGVDGIYQPGILNRSIKVIIRYVTDDAQVQPVQRHRSPKINIKTPNDSSNGIAAGEFELGQKVSIPPRKGADARLFHLARIVKQTASFVIYEVH